MYYLILPESRRGFFSCVLTILNSFKTLDESGINLKNVLIDPNYFILYGNIKNWFDICYTDIISDKKIIPVLSEKLYLNNNLLMRNYPDKNELSKLKKYLKYIPFNKKILNKIKNIEIYPNTVGVHFRGSEHYHSSPINKPLLFDYLKNDLKVIKKIFICSDDSISLFNIKNELEEYDKNIELYFYEDSLIFKNTKIKSGFHTFNNFNNEQKIKMGDDIIVETYMLSKCDKIYGKSSNILNYINVISEYSNITYVQ